MPNPGIFASSYRLPVVTVTGGTLYTAGGYNYRVFTSNGTLTVSGGTKNIESFLLGGGGAGGDSNTDGVDWYSGGGGGAGQVSLYNNTYSSASYSVTVGTGGVVSGGIPGSGNSSSVFGTGVNISAAGGTGAFNTTTAAVYADGGVDGSGGSGYAYSSTGNPPESGGGGGGWAGGTQANGDNSTGTGGNGGTGTTTTNIGWGDLVSIIGLSDICGGGGGGGYVTGGSATQGGGSGGSNAAAGNNGTTYTGGGGGGAGTDGANPYSGGSGGSGIVVFRYT